MMNDLNYLVDELVQYAEGSITYGNPVEAEFASGSITYGAPVAGVFASIAMSIVDYTQLVGTTITIDGVVLTEGVDFTAAVDNNTTGTSLAAAIDALPNWTASGPGLVTATWVARGIVGNGKSVVSNAPGGIDIAGTGLSGVSSGGVNGDTIAVGGSTFTCVSSAPGASEFTDIVGLEALVEAVANVNSSQNGTVISITYATRGVAGNAITLVLGVANAGTMAVSGATLSGGLDGDTVSVNGTLCTAVASAPGANEFSNITELEVLVEAIAGINSSVTSGVINISADDSGVGGNAITLELGGANAGTMTISGATLTGGVDSTVTDSLQLDAGTEVVKLFLDVTDLTSGATLTVTPRTAPDNDNWQDLEPIVISANGEYTEEVSGLLGYFDVQFVINDGSATSPTVAISMKAIQAQADTEREHDQYISSALESDGVAKNAPGRFYGYAGRLDETAPSDDYFLFVYDAPTVPGDGALDATKLLALPKKIGHTTGTDTEFNFSYNDNSFKRARFGICFFLSTTDDLTKTLAGDYVKLVMETE